VAVPIADRHRIARSARYVADVRRSLARLAVGATTLLVALLVALTACGGDDGRRYYPSLDACASANPTASCAPIHCTDACPHDGEWYTRLTPSTS
jgi:hypothetical protein